MEAIKTRRSVRNFTGDLLKEKHKTDLLNYINDEQNLIGPFGNKINIIYNELFKSGESKRIGTYGFIKNAPSFLICICKNNKESLIDVGYIFEKLILFLEGKSIGTCWIGGTFNRKKLQLTHSVSEDEFIPVISPVGYPAKKKHPFEKVIRKVAKSDNRKDFDQLFFKGDFNKHITDESIKQILEYVRLAPSASNKQPWRIVVCDDETSHFYIERTPGYGNALGYDIQIVDMGIALSHYMTVSGKYNVSTKIPSLVFPNENYEYVFSIKE